VSALAEPVYKRLFKASPGKILVLRPHSFEIVCVTDAYLRATMTREHDILGKTLFEVFPDNPDDPLAEGVQNLWASLQRVQSLKTADIVGVLRYPVRRPDGSFEERYWSPVNSPVLDDAGDIEFIMHRVEDVTTIVQQGGELDAPEPEGKRDPVATQDIILRSRELRQALSKLQEYEARMRTAERLLHLGAWELNVQTGLFSWSEAVFDIFDVPTTQTPTDIQGYFALVHPDDREALLAVYTAIAEQHAPQIEFQHRIIVHDGEVRYIKVMGERHESADGEIVVGYVQDITSLVRTRHSLTKAEHLLRIADEKVGLGGWRVELGSETLTWTPETVAIHGMPVGYSPTTVAEAIQYYAPEYREVIQRTFERCAQQGEAFDVVCQLQLAEGRQPWVRSIGAAERDQKGRIVAVQGAFQNVTVLHEARTHADEAERQKLEVLESISDAVFSLDEHWNFSYLNPQAGVLLDRPADQLLGKNVWTEFPEAVDSQFQDEYQKAVESQQTSRFQAFYPPLDKWFDVSAYPIPEGLTVYIRDVTLEREHQEQLRLVEAALAWQNDIVIITTADALDHPRGPRIVYVNEAFERQTGYTRAEALGKTPRLLHGPTTDRQQLDRIRHALQNREPIRCEVLNYKKSGDRYWLELDITPLFDDAGLCTHFVAVERDITQRKQQEAELRQARERFELISKATNDVVWDWNITTDEIWRNDAITEVFGYALSELRPGSEPWTKRIHPDDLESVLQSVNKVIAGEDEHLQLEYRFIKSNGDYAHVIDRGFVTRDADRKATRMVGSMLDITERIHLEERLRESLKLEAVGHLIGGVAHDFNNLLTVILGNSEMLAEVITDPQFRPMAEMAVSAAQRGAELTSRLLAFARRQPLDPKATDLNQLAESMRALIRRTLPENIELEFVPDNDLGITEIDASELDTALLNLVVNARDAMQGGGKLTIETANAVLDNDYAAHHTEVVPGEYVMICVSDTGVGMVPETVRHAVEPFFTTKSVGKGSGLGLSMVFGFTKQSGGHIKIYSEPGEGTTVKLYFPRVRGAQHTNYQSKVVLKPQAGTGHILIAEDDDLVLKHLETQLRSLGYRVTAVTTGPQALMALKAHSDIDLLLTDIIMPGGMNGRELADQAQTSYPRLKVLYTSGYTENAIVHHGRLDPGVELLSKPYTRLELATKVRRVITDLSLT